MQFDADIFAKTLVAEISDAIMYADAEGKIRLWNAGARRIFGFEQSEALGSSLDIIIPPSLRGKHWTGFEETMRTGKSRYGEGEILAVPAIRKDGSRISVEFTILPMKAESGQLIGIAAIMRDVTPRFQELLKLRKELASLNSAQGTTVSAAKPD